MRAQSGVRPEVVLVPWGPWRSTPPDDSSPAEESLAAARRAGLALTRASYVRFIEATDTDPGRRHRRPARQHCGDPALPPPPASPSASTRPGATAPIARARGGPRPRRPTVPGQRRGPRGPRLRAGPRPLGGRDAGADSSVADDPGRRPPRPPPRARAAVRAPAATGRRRPRAGRRRRGHRPEARRGADPGVGRPACSTDGSRRWSRTWSPSTSRPGRPCVVRRNDCATSPTRPTSASRPDCRRGWWPRTDATTSRRWCCAAGASPTTSRPRVHAGRHRAGRPRRGRSRRRADRPRARDPALGDAATRVDDGSWTSTWWCSPAVCPRPRTTGSPCTPAGQVFEAEPSADDHADRIAAESWTDHSAAGWRLRVAEADLTGAELEYRSGRRRTTWTAARAAVLLAHRDRVSSASTGPARPPPSPSRRPAR